MMHSRRVIIRRPPPHPKASWSVPLLRSVLLSVLFLLTAVFAITRSDWPELLRRLVILHARYALHRDVRLGRIHVSPRGQIDLDALSVSNLPGQPGRLFTAARITLRVDTLRLAALPFRPVGAIRQVVITQPSASLTRDARGRWNIQDLLDQKRPPAKDPFRGEVIVRGGEVVIHDATGLLPGRSPFSEHLVNLSARLTQAGDTYLPFRLTASSALGHLGTLEVSGGLDTRAGRVQCEARGTAIDAGFMQQLLPKMLVHLQSGRADGRWELRAARHPDTGRWAMEMTALADLHQVQGTLRLMDRTVPISVTDGQLRLANDVVDLVGIQGTVGGVPVTLSGAIANFTAPVLALQLQIRDADGRTAARLIPGLEGDPAHPMTWGGTITGWAQLTGAATSPEVTAHLSGPSLTTEFGTAHAIAGDLLLRGNALQITNLTARGLGGDFAGRGWLTWGDKTGKDTRAYFDGQATGIRVAEALHQFVPDLPPLRKDAGLQGISLGNMDGTVSGPIAVEVGQGGRSATTILHCQGDVTLAGVTGGPADVSLEIETTPSGVRTHVERAVAYLPEGVLQLRGSLDEQANVDFTLRGSEINLAAIGRHLAQDSLDGIGYFTGRLQGPVACPTLASSFHVKDVRYAGHAITDATGDLRATLGLLPEYAVHNLRVTAGDVHVTGNTSITCTNARTGAFTVSGQARLRQTSITALQQAVGVALPLRGYAEGEIAWSGLTLPTTSPTPGSPFALLTPTLRGHGSLRLRRPSLPLADASLDFDSASAEFAVHGTTVDLNNAILLYRGTPVAVNGTLALDPHAPAPQLSLRADAPALDLDSITALARGDQPAWHPGLDEGRWPLPFDLNGTLQVGATITAQLFDTKNTPLADVLAGSLQINGTLDGQSTVQIAGIPYQACSAALGYRAKDQTLTLSRFALQRLTAAPTRDYLLTLAAPSTVQLDTPEIDLHIALRGAQRVETDPPRPADVESIRQDLLAIAANTHRDYQAMHAIALPRATTPPAPAAGTLTGDALLAGITQAVQAVPTPFAAHALLRVDVEGPWPKPFVTVRGLDGTGGREDFAITDLVLADRPMPNITGALTYDTAPRTLTIDRLVARGGPSKDTVTSVDGTITIPERDAHGGEIVPGPIELSLTTEHLDPRVLGESLHNAWLAGVDGQAFINATISGTTASPRIEGSLEMPRLVVHGVPFDRLDAKILLREDPAHPGRLRLMLGNEITRNTGETVRLPALLNFVDAAGASPTMHRQIEPLECFGYMPIRWGVPFANMIPDDEELYLSINLPQQGLDAIHAYLPDLPVGDGTMRGNVEVHGTRRRPIMTGAFVAQAPELLLPSSDQDLPDRLTQASVDLRFTSDVAAGVNTLEVRDISAIYSRPTEAPPKPDPRLVRWVKRLFGIRPVDKRFLPGAVVAQGTVQLVLPKGGIATARTIPDYLQYDLYAKAVHAPLRWRDLLTGRVTSYLHLKNRIGADHQPLPGQPLLTGVVYAENSRISYTGQAEGNLPQQAMGVSSLLAAFNPTLSLALQIGPGNVVDMRAGNTALGNSVSASMPLTKTAMPVPMSPIDLAWPPETKPVIAPEQDFAFEYSSDFMQGYTAGTTQQKVAGSRGWVTGSLHQPTLQAEFALDPRKGIVQLPGGSLTITQAEAQLDLSRELVDGRYRPRPGDPDSLVATLQATGTLDRHTIVARITEKNLFALHDRPEGLTPGTSTMPVGKGLLTLTDEGGPAGERRLSSDEIYARLTGGTDLVDLLRGQKDVTQVIRKVAPTIILDPFWRRLANKVGLESLGVDFDPTRSTQASLTTGEFGVTRWSAFRLGASRTFSVTPAWKLWVDYRPGSGLPKGLRFLNSLSVSANTNDQRESGLSLQYKFPF